MTDRFVPEKPGLYLVNLSTGLQTVVAYSFWLNDDGAAHCLPSYAEIKPNCMKFIAPVPPPDVVDGLVAALEWYEQQAKAARLIHSGGDAGRHALSRDGGDKARAALQRFRGK